jgi:hypothetical protein
MVPINALQQLQDDELCVITTNVGEREVFWNALDQYFYYMDEDLQVVCNFEDIEEWRPASIKF